VKREAAISRVTTVEDSYASVRGLRAAVALACVASLLVFAVPGSAVPKHAATAAFEPFRASFVSPTTGFVLGTQRCSTKFDTNPATTPERCTALVMATSDAGVQWRSVPAPATSLSANQVQTSLSHGHVVVSPFVSGIVFADALNGWLYGPALWSTHDGGMHWTRINLNRPVYAVTVAGETAYAMTTANSNGVLRQPLLSSPVDRDDWQPVTAVTAKANAATQPNAVFASTVWVATGVSTIGSNAAELWRSSGGTSWQSVGYPCGRHGYIVSLAASSATNLVVSCGPRGVVYGSTDGGVHVQRAPGLMGEGGILGQIATPPGSSGLIIVSLYAESLGPSPSTILRSTDGGRSMTPTTYHDHSAGFIDLQFVSPTAGWLVHGYPGASVDELMQTTDAGATFAPVAS
jgi:photosystem II stability/assembly factor-like uncharacterized protein